MSDPRDQLQADLANRYVLERELGRGGMATVYLARDLKHDRSVALKVLHPELAATLGPERFEREIKLAARLQHPHILTVLDSGEAAGQLWFTMPYVEGESLRDRLQREKQLPLEDGVGITREVADALGYAHSHGIVHRDIKPENILLSRGHALVADFGVACGFGPGAQTKLTSTGLAVGTPAYMAPEQVTGGPVDGRTDVYALGCVLYEMLAGEPPYSGPTPQAIFARRFLQPVPAVEQVRSSVPAGVAGAIRRAMALEPADRFPTLEEFSSALAQPGGLWSAAKGTTRQRVIVTRTTGGLLLAVILGVALWTSTHVSHSTAAGASSPLRLAVLPFENEGAASQAYFADGITDAVRGKLTALPALQVIASGSTEEYRTTRKLPHQVGRELGVPYILVGKVRWTKDAAGVDLVQVSPELVDTRTGATRWQEPYQGTLADIFQLQAQIAEHVARALGLALGRQERAGLQDSLTKSLAAYDAYLRGQEARVQYLHYNGALKPAVALFRRAIALDTGFAMAKVRLADALRGSAMAGGDTAQLRQADSLIDAVLRWHPDLADAYVVKAEIRQYRQDQLGAYQLLIQAATLQKNNADVLGRLAWLQATEGDSAALRTGALAVALGPRDLDVLRAVVAGTSIFRHFDQLERYCDQLIAISPDDEEGYLNKALAQVWSKGDTAGAMRTLRAAELAMGGARSWMAWPYAAAGPSGWVRVRQMNPRVLGPGDELADTVRFFQWKTRVAAAEGLSNELRVGADSIVAFVNRAPRTLPSYGTLLIARAYAHAVRGHRAAASRDLAAGEASLSHLPVSWRNQWGPDIAEAYALVGDTTRALAEIRRTLSRPTGFTRQALRYSPEFAWLWHSPALAQLLGDPRLP